MKLQITNSIVTTDWLQEHIHATNLVVLNGTISKVSNDKTTVENHQIPNARFFDIKKVFSVVDAPFPNTMVSAATFTKEAQKLGINQNSAIVVYDELGMYAAPRVWYMFKAMGFENIAVLNGGFPAWKAAKYPVEIKHIQTNAVGNFQGKNHLNIFYNYTEMLQALDIASNIILDARSEARFTGKTAEPRKGLRSGQIPNSQNLPYTKVLNEHYFKSKTELQNIFKAFHKENSTFIFSCGSGITACILALAATYAGYEKCVVYDGSWTEWGSRYQLDQ